MSNYVWEDHHEYFPLNSGKTRQCTPSTHEWVYDTLRPVESLPPKNGLFSYQTNKYKWLDAGGRTHRISAMSDSHLVNVVKMVVQMARTQQDIWAGFLYATFDRERMDKVMKLTPDQILHANLPCWKALKTEIIRRDLLGVLVDEEVWF